MEIKTTETWTFFMVQCPHNKDKKGELDEVCGLNPEAERVCQPCDCPRIYDGQRIQNLLNRYEEIKKDCPCFRIDSSEWCAYPSCNSDNDTEAKGNCMFDMCPEIEKITEEEN
jgi:hypothetical protein